MSKAIEVARLLEVRTMSVRADSRQVVLRFTTANGELRHYELTVAELAGLPRQRLADATLLGGTPPGERQS